MRLKSPYCLLLLMGCALFASDAYSQSTLKFPSLSTDFLYIENDLKGSEEEYIEVCEDLLNTYMRSSTFYDNGGFSIEKYGTFSSEVFSSSCLMPNYLLSDPKVVELHSYLDYVYTHLKDANQGIKIDYKLVELLEIVTNPSGNVIAKFNINLELKTFEDKDGVIQNQIRPRFIDLEGTILLSGGNLNSSKIIELTQTNMESKSGSFHIVSGGASFGFGKLSAMNEFGFQNVRPSVSSTGIHLNYLRAVTTSNKIFLWAGLDFKYLSFNTDYSNKFEIQSGSGAFNFQDEISREFFSGDNLVEDRVSSLVLVQNLMGGEESLKQSLSFSVIVGGQYVYDVSTAFDLLFGFGLMPSLLLSNNNGSRVTNFEGINLPRDPRGTVSVDPNFPSLEELEDAGLIDFYTIRDEIQESRVGTSSSQLSFNLIGQINLHYRVAKKWGISGGVQGIYGLTNFLNYSGGNEQLLLGREDESVSILEDFAPNSNLISLGLNAGVYFQFGSVVR